MKTWRLPHTSLLAGILSLVASSITPLAAQQIQFGSAAAFDGETLLIGQPVNPRAPGAVLLFERGERGWTETGRIESPEPDVGDYFGRFILVGPDELLVSATAVDNSTGAVYRFVREGEGWAYRSALRPEGLQPGWSFGRRGVIEDDRLFVSGLGYGGEGQGAVFVFHKEGTEWVYETRITPSDAQAQDFFGWSIAAEGDRLLVGAFQPPVPGTSGGGKAYIFERDDSGRWLETGSFGFDDRSDGPRYGESVAWVGEVAVVGAPFHAGGAGRAYAYVRDGSGGWTEGPVLSAFDAAPQAGFGFSLRGGDDHLWVGTPGAGAVYLFTRDDETGEFQSATKVRGRDLEPQDGFGEIVAANDDELIVAALGDDGGLGSVQVVRRIGESWLAGQRLIGDSGAPPAITGGKVTCAEGRAEQFPCERVDILGLLPVDQMGAGRGIELNDVWGWTDPETGREYALVGRTDGTSFVDVTDPQNPRFLGDLPKTAGSQTNAWRDVKVYGNHAFIVADGAGAHGMQVFDLTRLRDVGEDPVTFRETARYDGIASAHNIVINEDTGTAFAVGANGGGETCGGGLHMIDIRQPDAPTFIGCFQDSETGREGTGYSHDAQCVVYQGPDEDYQGREVCFGSNETAVSIADVTDRENPVAISRATYANVGYTHQGWLTEDQRYFFLGDELDEMEDQAGSMTGTRTLVFDVSDLDDPVLVDEHFGTTRTIDHNQYVRGNLLYQSNYVSGLRILDISDPGRPIEVGYLDTVPWDESVVFDGSWSNYPFFESGTIVVTSGNEGLFLLRYRPDELVP